MKKNIKLLAATVVSLSALTGVANAAQIGSYAGIGLGYSEVQLNNVSGYSKDNSGVAGRLYSGYNLTENFGLELGFTRYADTDYKAGFINGYDHVTIKQYAADLVGKVYLPITNTNVDLYALGGLAYVKNTGHSDLTVNGLPVETVDGHSSGYAPKVGVGASFAIPQSPVVASVEISRIQENGDVPASNLATVSMSYNFGL